MTVPSVRRAGALLAVAALAFSLSACGGSTDEAPAEGAKDALLLELRQQASEGGANEEQVTCIVEALRPLTTDQLTALRDDAMSAETEAAVDAALDVCIPAE
jgi:hypothetical protein